MNVTICTEYYHPTAGATAKVIYSLVDEISRTSRGIEFTVITGDRQHREIGSHPGPAAAERLEVVHKVSTLRLDRSTPWKRLVADISFALRVFAKVWRGPTPDLVVVVTNPFVLPIVGWLMYVMRGVPYLYVVHDLYPDIAAVVGVLQPRGIPYRALSYAQGVWLRSAAQVVVLGRCMSEVVQARYGVPRDKLTTIPNWGEVDKIQPRQGQTHFRSRHCIDGFLVAYSGNMGHFHEFDTILDAAISVKVVSPGVVFALVGAGAQLEAVQKRIEDEDISNVIVLPLVPEGELADLLSSADAMLVTLKRGAEGLAVPLKFYNILAAGRPVIAVMDRKSEVARVVDEAQCGFVVQQGDGVQLERAVLKLSSSRLLCTEMGRRARMIVENRYTLKSAARHYVSEMTRAVRDPSGRGKRARNLRATR